MGNCYSPKKRSASPGGQVLKDHSKLDVNPGTFVSESEKEVMRKYMHTKTLGEGTFGKVTKAVNKSTGEERAIKIIDKRVYIKHGVEDRLTTEVDSMKKLIHPNIIKVFEYSQDERYFYIVTELCKGGDLFELITDKGAFSERDAAQVMKQLLSAVTFLHSKGVVHRDIKPNNLMFEDSESLNVKLIDFGAAAQLKGTEKLRDIQGTVCV